MKTQQNVQALAKKFRKEKQLTQKEFANLLGVTLRTIQQLEDLSKAPNPKMLLKITIHFDLPPTFFFKNSNICYEITTSDNLRKKMKLNYQTIKLLHTFLKIESDETREQCLNLIDAISQNNPIIS
jgi:transcriptional regulator with XRE-family HTH domain